jgi:flavin reductase (DIM6/NTAB) family NADH-FMN oxidoreductase RutF
MDPAAFRHVLGHFASGLTAVTSIDDDGPIGMTVQSFASVSLDPPLVLIVPSRSSTSYPRIRATGRFCVNVLSARQEWLCHTLARPGAEKWAQVDWDPSAHDTVRLPQALAWIDCDIEAEYSAGDHVVVLGRVRDLATTHQIGADPLLFFQGNFGWFRQ